MKKMFDEVSYATAELVTKKYSTSFSLATKMLSKNIRSHIYNIYGFVRFADEIVDSFHDYNKEELLNKFEEDYYLSKQHGISLNPILNSFNHTVTKFAIADDLVQAFLKSMRADLHKTVYETKEEYDDYIYGSADVVGLMCLKVFVNGDEQKYEKLKEPAMRLGSAFQKVNFLRDLKDDYQVLHRTYFPNVNFNQFTQQDKDVIVKEIEDDFDFAYKNGILQLPVEARLGVFMAYRYYKKLLKKLKKTPSSKILDSRIRISNIMKINLLARSYVKYKLNLL